MIKSLYDYQEKLAHQVYDKLKELKIVMLHFATRRGKTPVSLRTAELYGAKNVLFVTQKKAISGVEMFTHLFNFDITIINYESLHKISGNFDFIIVDESHTISKFPKPAKRTKLLKEIVKDKPLLLLTATPALESPSQYYHQFWISENTPFKFKKFYTFARKYIDIEQKYLKGRTINLYKKLKADTDFIQIINKYAVKVTEDDIEGFKGTSEDVITVKLSEDIQRLTQYLIKNRYFKFKDGTKLVIDTPMKLMQTLHQLSSGVIKVSDNDYKVLDETKAKFIRDNYSNYKIAVYYLYKGEEKMLMNVLNTTHSLDEFNQHHDKVFIGQFRSASMGVNLSKADYILFMNIPYSATTYTQVKARSEVKGKKTVSKLVWVFSEYGMENKILQRVKDKIDYSLRIFEDDYGIQI